MEKKIKVIRPLSELQNTKPKLRVCAYCRVSTEQEDQNGSYETQKAYYEQYIKGNSDWEFAGIYADRGTGTNTKNRNAFNEMIEDCEDNKIDLIICKSISRFARNTLDTIKIARELKDEGVYIIFEKENINTEKTENELAFNLLASFAQMESESISKNIQQGIHNRFKNVEYSISKAPYGYIKVNKNELIINETEAEVVRLIFKMYIEGYSGSKIADYINENKLDSSQIWGNRRIIKLIIQNEIYIGTMILQKYISIEPRKSVLNIGYTPMYELKNNHPPIISKGNFEKANEILRKKRKKTGREKVENLVITVFARKIVCGDCGSTLKIYNFDDKENIYVCRTVGCRKNKITINCIKQNFVKTRNELVKNYENLLMSDEITNEEGKLEYNKKLNDLNRQKEIVYRLKEDDIIDSAIFIEKNNKINIDITKIEEKMYALSFDNTDKERKKLIKYVKKLSETKRVEEAFQDEEFNELIDKVYVKGDIITYVIKTGVKFEHKNNYEIVKGVKYGYKKINGKHIVNDYEKDIINYMFNQYIAGNSTRKIAKNLNEKGIKTKTGKTIWDKTSIMNYLKNKEYLGDDIHPKLVEEEQFIKVQEILKSRKNGGRIKNERI